MFGRSVGCCCNIVCCFCIFYNTILCSVLALLIFVFIFNPQEPKFTVTDASLTRFNFTNDNNTLHYNLALNITIRNPNRRVGIYYRRIQVIANYRKKRFAMVTLPSAPFYQGHKNTTILNHVLVEGQQLVVFGEQCDLSQFNLDTAAGVYSIDVKISLRVRARFGKIKTPDYGPSNINCNLKVPLSLSETLPSGFNATKCRNVHVLTNPSDYARI
ncbi:protein YLS9-like [Pyrus ussuriensis x Pyrus communis]|uniref:Protein YLS9-like n=1 Tax=Pyrus ussuriensis x Pyrus communis TaxID=2448454 RepID=A0A5N5HZD5_9ROSA|nr:protein YLS9-like [Pyrus ussuriensis x Pyrus communis]